MPATLAEKIKIAYSYALGDPMQPTLASSGQGKVSGTTVVPVHRGSSIALITRTTEEMTGQIISTVRPRWRP
jgi:hypothetical protein